MAAIGSCPSSDFKEELPDVWLVNVRDAESGREVLVNTSSAKVRARYAQAAHERARKRDELFRRTRVDAIHVRTDHSYIEEIHRFFRMRGRRHV